VEVSEKLSLEREWIKGGWSWWLDQGSATQERLTMAAEEMPENGDKPLKNLMKG
jgi:hypothetical protein